MSQNSVLENSGLGKKTVYRDQYEPSLLYPIPRALARQEFKLGPTLPFVGYDLWNAFEFSWLSPSGKPEMRTLEIVIPCASVNIIESKSFKLYLYSFNNSVFASDAEVQKLLQADLSKVAAERIDVRLYPLDSGPLSHFVQAPGQSIDAIEIDINTYTHHKDFLIIEEEVVRETLHSHLLRSNCPITNKPDWGSLIINYQGAKINQAALLKYIVSLRNNNEFHEHCIERIFIDIMHQCNPQKLSVTGRYCRRGSLDINPFRSTENYEHIENARLFRQ